ncbi:SDR family NAD(P)-dependent oxidoreductase [Pseudaestuariivita sp.]|uniref:SDR family NAD(P)-dependent oxidoreductase n=1 Tax=Pseudaestuariivita sp. TaxID=2211669 RepID=UPI004058A917
MSGVWAIFGGAGGIGRALCALCEARGQAHVVFDLAASLEKHPPACASRALDAGDPASCAEAVAALAPDGGFAAAAMLPGFVGPKAPLAAGPDAAWDEVIAGNLTGTYTLIQAVLPHMARPGGALVLTGSGLGHFPRPGYGAYAVAKAGVAALGRQLALELAPDVRVNTVAPSAVDTAFLRGGTGRSDEARETRIDVDAYGAQVPLGRIAQPADVAGPMAFLMGPDAAYVTGQTLHINGGSFIA